jgi:hypothetical protein
MTKSASAKPTTATKPVHVFKAGTHTSASGDAFSFSDADILQIAESYNAALHQAPIVIGHPETDSPAWGWVDHLEAQDGNLFAHESKVDPDFAELRTAGRYDKRSIALYAPTDPENPTPGAWYLKHVGYLGGMPPAVKGLQSANFAATGTAVIFSEPVSDESTINQPATKTTTTQSPESTQPVSPNPNLPKELSMTPEQIAELQAKAARVDAAEAKITAAEAEVTTLKAAAVQTARAAFAEKRTAEATEFATAQIKRGVLQPALQARVVALLAQEPAKVEFSEGGSTVNTDAAQIVRDVLTGAVAPVEFGEHAGGKPPAAKVGSDAELHDKATALAKKDGISYTDALKKLV